MDLTDHGYHIEAETKWPTFPDVITKWIFFNENILILITEVCPQGSNQQYFSIGSDNGLAPSRPQTIIWINDGQFTESAWMV